MKNIFLTFAVIIISSFALSYNASAKNDLGIYDEDMSDLSRPIIINVPEGNTKSDVLSDINDRAIKNFRRNYPGVNNEEWSLGANHAYMAQFSISNIKTLVVYDRNGVFDHSLAYYNEEKMPSDVRQIVKSVYYDYAIISVAEVNINVLDAQTIYIINVQGKKDWMLLTISNSEILKVEKFNRS